MKKNKTFTRGGFRSIFISVVGILVVGGVNIMKLRNKLLMSLIVVTLLHVMSISVFCLPSMDKYKDYESNIVEYCDTGEGFVFVSDQGTFVEPPKGESNIQSFTYYLDGDKIKQVYKTETFFCVVLWDGDQEPHVDIYYFK